ncbi:DeoR/GlpR family DNA-binding transcription regulator [Luethyella okanaganae]|uniref:DeoR/GlpR family DNA-binding transcription regulator n=1 Tax=Luethyella okanaganae TaxID=69372 RepID=A0ABW1VFW1_9MICO
MQKDDREALPPRLRREQILALLEERGFVRVSELSDAFGVSGVTARADLDLLVDEGIAERVHGGAVPADAAGRRGGAHRLPAREPSFEEALEASARPKQHIGELAASLVKSGQSVLLDVGTTTLAVARALKARADLDELVVVTNGLSIALELESAIPRFTVIVTGGALRPLQHSLVDPLADLVLDRIHADVAFIGCNGVDAEHGVTNVNLPEAAVKARMLKAAARSVIVADASKLGETHLGRIGSIDEFDLLVTDAAASARRLDELRGAGLTVVGDRLPTPPPDDFRLDP